MSGDKHRRVRITHAPLAAPYTGLVIEKELALRGGLPVLDVRLRVRNPTADAQSIALRAQQCLPPRRTTITVPMALLGPQWVVPRKTTLSDVPGIGRA